MYNVLKTLYIISANIFKSFLRILQSTPSASSEKLNEHFTTAKLE